jgi:acetoacetate decarboxylase
MSLGFAVPLSPKGIASLAATPPWHYAGDVLAIEFWANPDAVAATLPVGLAADPETGGHGIALFIDWQFTGSNDEYLDPVRSQYHEFFLLMDARWEGEPVAWCPYIYVDNDHAMARGWIQGFPKKLGAVCQTRLFDVPSPATPSLRKGARFAASVSAAGRRLGDATVTLQAPASGLAALGRPTVNLRHFPRLASGQWGNPAVHELVMAVFDNQKLTNIWTGDATLEFPEAEGEEVAALNPVRVDAGYRFNLGYSVTDLRTLTGDGVAQHIVSRGGW